MGEGPNCLDENLLNLTFVPGAVGSLTDWIVSGARRPNRLIALSAAVTIVGTLIGRRIAGPTISSTHLYVVALAGTAAGKQHAIDCIKAALDCAGAGCLIGPGSFASAPAVVNYVKRQPLALCTMDEFGSFLRRINNVNAGRFETEITGELRKLWGISWGRYDSSETAKTQSQAVHCPALSIFAVSTPEDFYTALKSEDVGNGFLNRFLIVETGPRANEQFVATGLNNIPANLDLLLKRLYQPTPHSLPILSMSAAGKLEPSKILHWGAGAQQLYEELSKSIEDESDVQRLQLKSRVPEMAVRLATIRAAGKFSDFISAEDMAWGRDLALASANMLCAGVERHLVVTFEFSEICPAILSRMKSRSGTMTRRDILRSFQKHVRRGVDIEAALKHLLESEQITQEERQSSGGGRKSIIYSLASE